MKVHHNLLKNEAIEKNQKIKNLKIKANKNFLIHNKAKLNFIALEILKKMELIAQQEESYETH